MLCEELIRREYFEWILKKIDHDRYSKDVSYRKLLTYLHNVPFHYSIKNDSNRYEDGLVLRYRFSNEVLDITEHEAEICLVGPCSVMEMMAALAIRCEESIMDDPRMGNRTGQWFWRMIVNLGLGPMTDQMFDGDFVEDVVTCFLDRKYSPNGKGGLFTVRDTFKDLRKVEIWSQMCWYLNTIT